jgi:hypothetical protein
MSSPVAVIVIAAAAVLAGVGIGCGARHVLAPRFVRRAAAHRFAREFASLVEGTELDLATLRGPSHDSSLADTAATAAITAVYSTTVE